MSEDPRSPSALRSAQPVEYIALTVAIWWLVSRDGDLPKPVSVALILGLSFGACFAYALLKPEVLRLFVKDPGPRMSLGHRLAEFRSHAVSILIGGFLSYGFLLAMESWLGEGEWSLLTGLAVYGGSLALFLGGIIAGHFLDEALRSKPEQSKEHPP